VREFTEVSSFNFLARERGGVRCPYGRDGTSYNSSTQILTRKAGLFTELPDCSPALFNQTPPPSLFAQQGGFDQGSEIFIVVPPWERGSRMITNSHTPDPPLFFSSHFFTMG
jgi:hypothetical protein